MPASGLKATAVMKIVINMFALFHILAEDERLYPNLPDGMSTFSLFSPLGGALCSALQHFQKPAIAAAWDNLSEKVGSAYQTLAFFFALGDLIELF